MTTSIKLGSVAVELLPEYSPSADFMKGRAVIGFVIVSMVCFFAIVAAVIFMLSYIFKYGTELQKLSDETV